MNNNSEYTGLGKRKTSVAKVFLKAGTGLITVNNKQSVINMSSLEQNKNFKGSLSDFIKKIKE